jgi:TonB-dependent SusC/RagA subfamily outer membrane receptor
MQLRALAVAAVLFTCLAGSRNAIAQDTIIVRHDPLFIIDSVRMDMDSLPQVNPSSIAMITVLKDSAATRQYGADATNGVILIVTKKFMYDKYLRFIYALPVKPVF